eukprot:scaffold237487_cov37-Tisochrysis_lutea.AAC.1
MRAVVDEGADDANEECSPRKHGSATRSDGDEAGEDAIADHRDVIGVRENSIKEHARDATGTRGEGSAHGSASHDGAVALGGDAQSGARVKTVPAHPEDESAEHDKGGRVARHSVGLAVLIKAANARLDDGSGAEGRNAASHVHDTGAREVEASTKDGEATLGGEGA